MNSRLLSIRLAPLSWKDIDMVTAAEMYMTHSMEIEIIEMLLPCFPNININIQEVIERVWYCLIAAWHLELYDASDTNDTSCEVSRALRKKVTHLYQKEAQRLLGSLFQLDHPFWHDFYRRQEEPINRMLCAIDALHHACGCQQQVSYQLIIQTTKSIAKAQYKSQEDKKYHYGLALRLIRDLPLTSLISWITDQIQLGLNQRSDDRVNISIETVNGTAFNNKI
ncbi:MAG: hypothetical protein V3V00_08835 [Saprospiraceae bacterium]